MTSHPPSLLSEIERDLIDGRPVAEVLLKLIVLGGRAGSSELRDWASRELKGYPDATYDELPGYRKVPSIIQMDAQLTGGSVKHQTVAPQQLPEEGHAHITNMVPFFQGVAEIQAMVDNPGKDRTIRLAVPGERLLAQMIDEAADDPMQHTEAIYWAVSPTALEGVIAQIRTRLAELLGELRALTPASADAPTAAQAAQAVSVVVKGRGNRVNVASTYGDAATVDPADASKEAPFWTPAKKVGSAIVGVASIVGVVIAWLQYIG
jgi:hypothetical protein